MFLYLIQSLSLSLSDRPHSIAMADVFMIIAIVVALVVAMISVAHAWIRYQVQRATRTFGIPMVYSMWHRDCLPRDPPVLMRT